MSDLSDRTDIRTLTGEQLEEKMVAMGEKPYRARQVHEWLWNKSATSFSSMTNLPLALREQMNRYFVIHPSGISVAQHSSDGTIKAGFMLHDNNIIESVLIPREKRMTVCVSSQVGCSLACKFCATGYLERKRNLDPAEIYDQDRKSVV